MKKILIFTAGFGEGHNTAARSLRAAVEHIAAGDGTEARVIDLFAECYGRRNEFVRKAYVGMINHTPRLWQWVYRWLDRPGDLEANLGLLARAQNRLAQILEEEKPDVVASTYPSYNYLINRIYPGGARPPFKKVTIVTDSITVNSVWYRCDSDYFIVPNEDTAAVLRDMKVDEAKIKALGFPVTHLFSTEAADRQPPGEGNRRVLYMINSGKGEATNLVKRLLALPGLQLTVTVGRDLALQAAVEKAMADSGLRPGVAVHGDGGRHWLRPGEAGHAAEVHGWTNQLPRLLMKNHLLISKAGGATVQETIAARTPMLIMQVVPGQEEGNARLLLDHDCGALTETTGAIVRTVEEAFGNGTKLWHQWERNLAKLSKPDAALVIARFLLGLRD